MVEEGDSRWQGGESYKSPSPRPRCRLSEKGKALNRKDRKEKPQRTQRKANPPRDTEARRRGGRLRLVSGSSIACRPHSRF